MTPKQLHDYFKAQIADVVDPELWSSDETYAYMDEAHKMFVRLIGGIPETENEDLCQVTFTAEEAFADLSPLVLEIRDASRVADGVQIDVFDIQDFKSGFAHLVRRDDDYYLYDGVIGRGPSIKWRTRTSAQIKALITGIQRNRIRSYPILAEGAEDLVVQLDIYRLPTTTITKANSGDANQFQIDDIHHRYLTYWMQFLAFSKHDADAYNKAHATLYEEKFINYCEKLVLHEEQKRKRRPMTIAYGGL